MYTALLVLLVSSTPTLVTHAEVSCPCFHQPSLSITDIAPLRLGDPDWCDQRLSLLVALLVFLWCHVMLILTAAEAAADDDNDDDDLKHLLCAGVCLSGWCVGVGVLTSPVCVDLCMCRQVWQTYPNPWLQQGTSSNVSFPIDRWTLSQLEKKVVYPQWQLPVLLWVYHSKYTNK